MPEAIFDSVYWKFKGQAALNEQGDPIDGGYAGISLANYHYPKFHDAENWEDATSLSYEPDVDGILPSPTKNIWKMTSSPACAIG